MTISKQAVNPQIAIYFAGGAGLNLGATFSSIVAENEILSKAVTSYFLDTSTGNHKPHHTSDNTLVLGGAKGSGKMRDKNYGAIKDSAPEIFHKFTPGVFNIVVHSASGGSGSTIAGVIVSEALERGLPVVTVTIGSTDSRKEVENTLKTMKSYEAISRARKKPVAVHYHENTLTKSRGAVDHDVLGNLSLLCLMFACVADKIDESDLIHFLDYPRVTSFAPGLVSLDLFAGPIKLHQPETVYAVTTLATADTSTMIDPPPEYQSAGFLSDDMSEIFGNMNLLHWAIIGGSFGPVVNRLDEMMSSFQSASAAHRVTSLLNDSDETTEDGLIL